MGGFHLTCGGDHEQGHGGGCYSLFTLRLILDACLVLCIISVMHQLFCTELNGATLKAFWFTPRNLNLYSGMQRKHCEFVMWWDPGVTLGKNLGSC